MTRCIILCFLLPLFACNRKSLYSDVPKITYKSMQPKIIQAGSSSGGTLISFIIEDGDGDIGFNTKNLYLKDSRDSTQVIMKIPEIPSEYGPNNGIKGTITVSYLSAWLLLRSDTAHINSDTLHWDIFIKDEAGNVSNTIQTEDLILMK